MNDLKAYIETLDKRVSDRISLGVHYTEVKFLKTILRDLRSLTGDNDLLRLSAVEFSFIPKKSVITQDYNGDVYVWGYSSEPYYCRTTKEWSSKHPSPECLCFGNFPIVDDYETAKVSTHEWKSRRYADGK